VPTLSRYRDLEGSTVYSLLSKSFGCRTQHNPAEEEGRSGDLWPEEGHRGSGIERPEGRAGQGHQGSQQHESTLANLRKKHNDAVAEMAEQVDQLNKLKAK